MASDSPFLIKNRTQIQQNLSLLHKRNNLLTAHFGEHHDSFITTIVGINPKQNKLLLDYGPKEYLNKMLLTSDKCTFRTEFSGIKVAFLGQKISKEWSDGQPVFSLPIPDSLFWQERRKFYRIKSPLSNPAYCFIPISEAEEPVKFNLFDISLSGFSVLNHSKDYAKQLNVTSEFKNCTLQLPETGEGTIAFIVCNQFILNEQKKEKTQRIGCQFTTISPAFESTISRYLQQLEREIRKKS